MLFGRPNRKLIGGFVLVVSVLLLIVTSVAFFYSHHFVHAARHTNGTIVELVKRTDKDSGDSFCPVFTFADSLGAIHTIYSKSGSYPPAFAVGQKVPVLYDPSNVDHAEIDDFMMLWGICLVTGLLGLSYLPIGLVIWYWPSIHGRPWRSKAVKEITAA